MAGPRKQAETAFVPTLDERLNNEFGDSNESVRVPDDAVFRDLESCLNSRRRWYWYIELAGLRWLDDESVPWNARCRTAILRARSRFESGTIHSAFSDLRTAISLAVSNGKSVEVTKQVFQASVIVFETAVTSAFDANDIENCIRLGAEWLHLESEFPCLDIEISDTALKAIATSEKESGSTCAIASVLSINKGLFGLCRTVVRFARGESPWRDETSSLMRELIRKATDDSQYWTIVDKINAEIAARVRMEEAKEAKKLAEAERNASGAEAARMQDEIESIRYQWRTEPERCEDALEASTAPDEIKAVAVNAWRAWRKARQAELDGNAALDTMERELAALPSSPDRAAFDETGIELHPVDSVPGIFDVAAALNARGDRMRKFADWENDEPKLEDVPVPNVAKLPIPDADDLKRLAIENVLSSASRPIAFLFRNAKYWAMAGGVLFLAFWWIPPLGRWAYGTEDSLLRSVFWSILEFFGPALSFVWRWHRKKNEEMRLYAEWALQTRKTELARRTAIWRKRGETLAGLKCETFESLKTAIDSTRAQIAVKRAELETETSLAAATVDSAFSSWTETAERAWDEAKMSTDAAVAKEEEKEKRRAEARIEFARLKDRTVPAIRAILERIRLSGDVTKALFERIVSAESELASWEARKDPLPEGLPAERHFAEDAERRAAEFESEWIQIRRCRANDRFDAAAKAFDRCEWDDCIAAAKECRELDPERRDADELRRKATEEITRWEQEIENWKTDAAEMIQNVQPGDDEPSRSVYQEMTEHNKSLRSFSSWKDRGRAHNEYNHICGRVRTLEGIGQIAEAREASRRRKEEAEESAAEWRECIPEALYPASARSSDEVWKQADVEAARGATESAKTEYEKAAQFAERALNEWEQAVQTAYQAMVQAAVQAADEPHGSERLRRWIVQTVQTFSPVEIFPPLNPPEPVSIPWLIRNRQYACPWMPENERSVSLPRPNEVLFATGNPESAGKWLADLSRFLEWAGNDGWRGGPDFRDQAVETRLRSLVEKTRELAIGKNTPQNKLLDQMKESLDWLSATEETRNRVRENGRESERLAKRSDALLEDGLPGDEEFTSQIREISRLVGEAVHEGHYEEAQERFDNLRSFQNELKAREKRHIVFKRIEQDFWVGAIFEKDRDNLCNRLKTIDYEERRTKMKKIDPQVTQGIFDILRSLSARIKRRIAFKRIERDFDFGAISENERDNLRHRLMTTVSASIDASHWEEARRETNAIQTEETGLVEAFSQNCQEQLVAIFAEWLSNNPDVTADHLESLRQSIRQDPFDKAFDLLKERTIPVRELPNGGNHRLVQLLEENGSVKIGFLDETIQAVLDSSDPDLPKKFQTMDIGRLQWVVGKYCNQFPALQRFLWRRSSENGDAMGINAWNTINA